MCETDTLFVVDFVIFTLIYSMIQGAYDGIYVRFSRTLQDTMLRQRPFRRLTQFQDEMCLTALYARCIWWRLGLYEPGSRRPMNA